MFAVTMRPIARRSTRARFSPSTIAPTAAARTGLTLMKIPKKCAGTRRSARRSARNGTTDDSTPEDVLGVRLLRRTSRVLVLTPAGERVLARARRVIAEVEDLTREARSGHGRLRIGH